MKATPTLTDITWACAVLANHLLLRFVSQAQGDFKSCLISNATTDSYPLLVRPAPDEFKTHFPSNPCVLYGRL